MATKTTVKKIFDDIFLEPGKSTERTWKIEQTGAWFFHAVPRSPQTSFPQKIHIERVQMVATEATKCVAHITIVNDTKAVPNLPQEDGCHFSLWVVAVKP
jgi:hypothetical protein